MSIYLPECNAQLTGTGGSVRLTIPAGASQKPANRGFVFGVWAMTPPGGYANSVQYNVASKANGLTGGADGYLRFNNQAGTQVAVALKNSGTTYMSTSISGVPQGKRVLLLVIQTASNYHLVACEPGGMPIVSSVAGTTAYTVNWSAVDVWDKFGVGASAGYGHYGPIEEAFFLLGEFPESGGVPDSTLIQNIANGAQDLATLDTQLTGAVAKKWRYRMRLASDLADAFGVAGNLTAVGTTSDKVLMTSGPLRPVEMTPDMTYSCSSQAQFPTAYTTTDATADILIEGGAYTGTDPAAIQARLLKEDGSVHVDWTTIDAAPGGGAWAAGQIANVPVVAGDLSGEIRKVDGLGAQVGESVGLYGMKGAGTFAVLQGQSQADYLADNGSGIAVPGPMRLTVHYFKSGVLKTIKVSSLNANSRIAHGLRRLGIEIDTLLSGVPVTVASLAVSGQTLESFFGGGANADKWAAMKTRLGVVQPFYLAMYGHSNASSTSYETDIGNAIAKCVSDFGVPIETLHFLTERYAGAGTSGSYVAANNNRTAIRDYVAANPVGNRIGGSLHAIKSEAFDVGPHPMDADVGQGRAGAILAWAIMSAAGFVEDEPMMLVASTRQPDGTSDLLTFGPVNAATGNITGTGSSTIAIGSSGAGSVDVAGQGSAQMALGGSAAGQVDVSGSGAGQIGLGGSGAGGVTVDGQGAGQIAIGSTGAGSVTSAGAITGSGADALAIGGSGVGQVQVAGQGASQFAMGGMGSGVVGATGTLSARRIATEATARSSITILRG